MKGKSLNLSEGQKGNVFPEGADLGTQQPYLMKLVLSKEFENDSEMDVQECS